jgi:hypothetical protein
MISASEVPLDPAGGLRAGGFSTDAYGVCGLLEKLPSSAPVALLGWFGSGGCDGLPNGDEISGDNGLAILGLVGKLIGLGVLDIGKSLPPNSLARIIAAFSLNASPSGLLALLWLQHRRKR